MCKQSNPEGRVENRMTDEADSPQRRVVDASDDDLTRRELQELIKRTFAMRRYEALRNEEYFRSIPLGCTRDRVVIADGTTPGIKNVEAMKSFAVDRRGSSPGKIAAMVSTKHAQRRRVPG